MMRVLVIGDACKDVFVYGKVSRLSPEGPIPILLKEYVRENLGMAYNVAFNISSLSEDAIRVDVRTDDAQGEDLNKKIRFVDLESGYTLLRMDSHDCANGKFDFRSSQIHIKNYDAVVVSDYGKGFLSKEEMQLIFKECSRYGIPSFLDTKNLLGEWSSDAFVVKINRSELKAHKGNSKFIGPKQHLIVTLGMEGAALYDSEFNLIALDRGYPVEVRNVSGAGDTFLAGLVVSYLESKDLLSAIKFANRAAATAVSKVDIAVVKRSELIDIS